jgi:4-diphosphocytidyl-2-C-methyl-D-erythritol kinase
MTALRVRAPAKTNWTLEVLGKRDDGYHEVRTILQTIDLSDVVTLTPADDVSLSLIGNAGALAGQPLEWNLAHRAATLLRRDRARGVHIDLEKHIPLAAGLGGGSSDAAAVLRGLNALWQLDIDDTKLMAIAGELGSDVPFFLHGGTALASGRGEKLDALPDVPLQRLLLAWPDRPASSDKTARMYAALRPKDFTDGSRTGLLAAHLRDGKPISPRALYNAFEQAIARVDAAYAQRLDELPSAGGPHLCGSGPAVFFLLEPGQPIEPLQVALEALGMRTSEARTLPAEEAIAIEELP